MMDSLAIRAAEAAVHPNFPAADTILIVELDGPAAEVRALFDDRRADVPAARRDDDRGRADRRAARAHLARTQGGVRGDGPRVAELLRAGRRRAAHEAAGGAEPHPRARSAIRAAHRQRVPRRRRQPASADLLRRADPGPVGRGRRGRRRRSCRTASRPAARSPASTAIGADKSQYMPTMFTPEDLTLMQRVRAVFDPQRPLQSRQGVPDAAAVRRSARAVPPSSGRSGRRSPSGSR